MTDHVLLACKGIMVTNVFHLQQTGRGMYESDDGDGTSIHLPPAFCYHPHFPACIGSKCWCCFRKGGNTPCFSTQAECNNACVPPN